MKQASRFATCLNCGASFTVGKRTDQFFCSNRCAAAYVRVNGPANIHAANHDYSAHQCENCGGWYYVNAYAERGGKRSPKFCSTRCRVAFHRKTWVAGNQEARDDKNRQPGSSSQSGSEKQSKRQQSAPPHSDNGPQSRQKAQGAFSEDFSFVGTKRRTTEAINAAYRILGLSMGASQAEIRAARIDLIKRYHPDLYHGEDAKERAQAINWAYDFLK